MTKPKLFVAIPVYGDMSAFFTRCLLTLVMNPPCPLVIRMVIGDSLVARARNTLTADFLESDCTHIQFLDSDLIFSPEHVGSLISRRQALVGGFYPKKQDGKLEWVCNALTGFPGLDRRNRLQPLRYIGTGFMLIRRDVITKMKRKVKSYHADSSGRKEWDFWSVGVHKKRYLSEDWYFCQRALDLGFKVYGDPKIVLKHMGMGVYPLQSQDPAIRAPFSWRDVYGWFTAEDAKCYHRIAQLMPQNGKLAEIGCFQGRSLGSFGDACDVLGKPHPRIYAIDTFKGTKGEKQHEELMPKFHGKLRALFEENMKRLSIKAVIHEMKSTNAAARFNDGELDAVFIDARHTRLAFESDLNAWLPKVKPDGVIAGHDFDYPPVRRAVKKRFPNAETIGRCWLVDLSHI